MSKILSYFSDAFQYIASMGWSDALDILIVAVVIYGIIAFIRRTRSSRIAIGIIIVLIAMWISSVLNLMVTNFILRQVFNIGILALIVLFQPEIRRALEKVGSSRFFSLFGGEWRGQTIEHMISQVAYACEDMSSSRTGALIVFERDNKLNDILVSGTEIDAVVSTELLKNIFIDKSPLHDGAVIIKDGRLAAAGCMLPLSMNASISRELGMRHRAGIGMSEQSDAVVIIVSEETGGISVAVDGLLKRHLPSETFEALLRQEILPKEDMKERGRLRTWMQERKGINHGEKGEE